MFKSMYTRCSGTAHAQVLGPDQFMAFFITAGLASSAVRALASQGSVPQGRLCRARAAALTQNICAAYSTRRSSGAIRAVCTHVKTHVGRETVTCVSMSVCVAESQHQCSPWSARNRDCGGRCRWWGGCGRAPAAAAAWALRARCTPASPRTACCTPTRRPHSSSCPMCARPRPSWGCCMCCDDGRSAPPVAVQVCCGGDTSSVQLVCAGACAAGRPAVRSLMGGC